MFQDSFFTSGKFPNYQNKEKVALRYKEAFEKKDKVIIHTHITTLSLISAKLLCDRREERMSLDGISFFSEIMSSLSLKMVKKQPKFYLPEIGKKYSTLGWMLG